MLQKNIHQAELRLASLNRFDSSAYRTIVFNLHPLKVQAFFTLTLTSIVTEKCACCNKTEKLTRIFAKSAKLYNRGSPAIINSKLAKQLAKASLDTSSC